MTSYAESPIGALEGYLRRYAARKPAFPQHPQDSPRRARRLLDVLAVPDARLSVVRVVGTKGKGSTAAMLAAVLQAAGYTVGLFTSPHLHSPRERIVVDGAPISRPAFDAGVRALLPVLIRSLSWDDLGPATLFEALTALGIAHFARHGADVAVVEAGMGGRGDATHALSPLLTLLTPIALDHQAYLGDTLAAIAAEKAGAILPGGHAISAAQAEATRQVIDARCKEVGADLRWSEVEPPSSPLGQLGLRGPHQAVNVGLVRAAVEALREMGLSIPQEAICEGLRSLHWPGRLEVVAGRPLTLVDVAHNPAAAAALAAALVDGFRERPRVLLVGCSADKDLAGIVAALAPVADEVVVTQARHYRAAVPEHLAQACGPHGLPVEAVHRVSAALRRARAGAGREGLVCACGSFFVVAEVREALGLAVREPWPEPIAAPSPHPQQAPVQ